MPLYRGSLLPQFAHIEAALESFRLVNGFWEPSQANIVAIDEFLINNSPPPNIDPAYLSALVNHSNDVRRGGRGGGGRVSTAAVNTVLYTPASLMAWNPPNPPPLLSRQDQEMVAAQGQLQTAITTANDSQHRILPLIQGIPEHYAHVRDALIAFALQDTWSPTPEQVAVMVTFITLNPPLNNVVDDAYLTGVVNQSGAPVTQSPTVRANEVVVRRAIAAAIPFQQNLTNFTALPPLGMPQHQAHIRDALMAFAIQENWQPTPRQIARMVQYIATHPLAPGATPNADYLTLVVQSALDLLPVHTPSQLINNPDPNAQKRSILAAVGLASRIQQQIEPLIAEPPLGMPQHQAHIRDALIVFAIQENWNPTAEQVAKMVTFIAENRLAADLNVDYLTRVVQAAEANQPAQTPEVLVNNPAVVGNAAKIPAVNAAIARAHTIQGHIQHFRGAFPLGMPEHQAHIRDALIAFAIQVNWSPTQAQVAKMVTYISANPLAAGAPLNLAYLTQVVQAAEANQPAQTPNALNNGDPVNAVKIRAVNAAINKANNIQGQIQHLTDTPPHGMPEHQAHIRDALVAFAIQENWNPTQAQVAAMVTFISANPLGAGLNVNYLTQVVQAAGAPPPAQTPEELVNNPAVVANAAKIPAVNAAIARAHTIQGHIQHFRGAFPLGMPEHQAHIRDALIAFAIQENWNPTAEQVKKMVTFIAANPLAAGAHLDLAYLTQVVQEANAPQPGQTPNALNNGDPVNAVKIRAVNAAINKANNIQGQIQHLTDTPPHGMPEHQAHIRDALVAFAIQDTWNPDGAAVRNMVTFINANPPVGGVIDHAYLTRVVTESGVAVTQRPTDLVGNDNANNAAKKRAVETAIMVASQVEDRIQHLHKVSLRELGNALKIHAINHPGFVATENNVIKLNRDLADLPPGSDAKKINKVIRGVWAPRDNRNNPLPNFVHGANGNLIVDEFRLAPLSKIIPPFRALLERHAGVNHDFKPSPTQVQAFNTAINELNKKVAGATEQDIDDTIQLVWTQGPVGHPLQRFFRDTLNAQEKADFLQEQLRLATLSKVSLSGLREALQKWAAQVPGFRPTPNEVEDLKRNLERDIPIERAILNVWPVDPAHPDNPPANFIALQENKDLLQNEQTTSRLTNEMQAKLRQTEFPLESHPALMALYQEFPMGTREAILKNDKLNSLLELRSEFELLAAARDGKWDANSLAGNRGKALIDENIRNHEFRKLGHSKIAEILGGFPIVLSPDPDKVVRRLNDVITGELRDYRQYVEDLVNATNLSPDEKVKLRDAFNIPANKAAVEQQHLRNQELYTQYRSSTSLTPPNFREFGKEAALLALARLEKRDVLSTDEVYEIVRQMRYADDYEAFLKNTSSEVIPRPMKAVLSGKIESFDPRGQLFLQKMYEDIRTQFARDKLRTPAQVGEELERQQPQLEAIKKSIAAFQKSHAVLEKQITLLNTENLKNLDRINGIHPLAWLAPDNEIIARQYAKELLPEFEELNSLCKDVCSGLQNQLDELIKLKKSLSDESQLNLLSSLPFGAKSQVLNHGKEIEKQIREVEILLNAYQNTHTLLNGDPRIPLDKNPNFANKIQSNGLVAVLRDARDANELKPSTSTAPDVNTHQSGFVDVDSTPAAVAAAVKKQRDDLKIPEVKGTPPAPTVTVATNVASNAARYLFANKGKLDVGKTRVHTIFTERTFEEKTVDGTAVPKTAYAAIVTEQVGIPHKRMTKHGPEEVQSLKINMQLTPPIPEAKLDADEKRDLLVARVECCTLQATKVLIQQMGSTRTPIQIGGSDVALASLQYQAFIELFKKYPNLGYTEKDIVITSEKVRTYLKQNKDYLSDVYNIDVACRPAFQQHAALLKPYVEVHGETDVQQKTLKDSKDTLYYKDRLLKSKDVEAGVQALQNNPTTKGI